LDGEITFKAGEPDDLLIQFNGKNLDLSVIDLPDKEEAQSEKHRLIPDLPVTELELGTMNVDIEVNLDSVRYRDVMLHNLLVDISLVEARLNH